MNANPRGSGILVFNSVSPSRPVSRRRFVPSGPFSEKKKEMKFKKIKFCQLC